MTALIWTILVASGALIGWLTNWVAIRLLFRPRVPVGWGFLRLQGVIPRRHAAIASAVAQMVEEELLSQHLVRSELHKIDLAPYLEGFAHRLVREHLAAKIKKIPLLGSFLNDSLLDSVETMAREALLSEAQSLKGRLADDLEQRLQVRHIVEERILSLDLPRLETMVWRIARQEFRAIVWMGAVLGGLVGLVQGLILFALGRI